MTYTLTVYGYDAQPMAGWILEATDLESADDVATDLVDTTGLDYAYFTVDSE